jgi:hypothetical protein
MMTDVKTVAVAAGARYEEHAPKSVRDGEGGPTRRRGRKLPRGTNNGIYGMSVSAGRTKEKEVTYE